MEGKERRGSLEEEITRAKKLRSSKLRGWVDAQKLFSSELKNDPEWASSDIEDKDLRMGFNWRIGERK